MSIYLCKHPLFIPLSACRVRVCINVYCLCLGFVPMSVCCICNICLLYVSTTACYVSIPVNVCVLSAVNICLLFVSKPACYVSVVSAICVNIHCLYHCLLAVSVSVSMPICCLSTAVCSLNIDVYLLCVTLCLASVWMSVCCLPIASAWLCCVSNFSSLGLFCSAGH